MPADLLQRILPTLDSLYPPFLAVLLEAQAAARKQGADYWATRGFATYAEQDALWERGRSTPGENASAERPLGYPVTDAPGGYSAHCFGFAVDFARDGAPDVPKLQPDWRVASYATLGAQAEARGLVWGGHFSRVDAPHVQWPGFVSGRQLGPMRLAFSMGGLRGAWAVLDSERARPEWQRAHPLLHAELMRLGYEPPATVEARRAG